MSHPNLFVVKQRFRDLFWANSARHGCGWHPGTPKQAFSPSELAAELREMIDRGHFVDLEIIELRLTP